MKQAKLLFLLIATLAFASCRPTARQAMVDAEQPTDSTEALTSADTLRLVIIDKSLSQADSVIRRTLKLPLNSIAIALGTGTWGIAAVIPKYCPCDYCIMSNPLTK